MAKRKASKPTPSLVMPAKAGIRQGAAEALDSGSPGNDKAAR
jgi:hypothetical protein